MLEVLIGQFVFLDFTDSSASGGAILLDGGQSLNQTKLVLEVGALDGAC